MKYILFCTTYNTLPDNSLQLRNNFVQEIPDDDELLNIIDKWKLPNDFKYLSKGQFTGILEGKTEIDCPIHVRIVRF